MAGHELDAQAARRGSRGAREGDGAILRSREAEALPDAGGDPVLEVGGDIEHLRCQVSRLPAVGDIAGSHVHRQDGLPSPARTGDANADAARRAFFTRLREIDAALAGRGFAKEPVNRGDAEADDGGHGQIPSRSHSSALRLTLSTMAAL